MKLSINFFFVLFILADIPVADNTRHDSQDIFEELVTLIERPQMSLQNTLQNCQYCQKSKLNMCYFDQTSVCGYQKVLRFIYPTSCIRKLKQKKPSVENQSQAQTVPKASEPDPASEEKTTRDLSAAQETPSGETASSESSDETVIVPTPPSPTSNQLEKEQMESTIKPSASDSVALESEKQTIPQSTVFESSHNKKEESLKFEEPASPKEQSNFNDCVAKGGTVIAGSGGGDTSCTMGPDVVQVRPSTPTQPLPEETKAEVLDDSVVKITDHQSQDNSKGNVESGEKSDKQQQEKQIQQSNQGSHQEEAKVESDTGGNGMKNIYAEEPSTDPSNLELEILILPDSLEEPIQKLSSKNKETAFMRLKNRIKELELNLNLSSRCVSLFLHASW